MKGKDIKGWKPLDKKWPTNMNVAILLRDDPDPDDATYYIGYMNNAEAWDDERNIHTGDEIFYISNQEDYEDIEWVYLK